MIAATLGPTPFWYATRGSGFTALVLLTAALLLGLLTSTRWTSPRWPRFLSQAVHRNVSLYAGVFLLIHIATSIIDPFAGLSVRDAIVPVGAGYRPLWLGLGVIAAELFVAVLLTSLVRHRLGFRLWRAVHLLSYASWPVAVLHGIGTGTDTKSVWAILLVVACVGSVLVTLVWRLSVGWPRLALLRAAGMCVSVASVIALAAWTAGGPLQPGWARLAGTPAKLLSGGAASSPSPAPAALPAGLDDPVRVTLQQGNNGAVTASLTDQNDASLRLVITVQGDGSARLQVSRSGQAVCDTAATIGQEVDAQCGSVAVSVQVFRDGTNGANGTLTTRAAGT